MLDSAVVKLGVLGLPTIIGLIFAFDGYGLANRLLAAVGWIAGGALGGAFGWVAATPGASNRVAMAGGALLFGALLGRLLVPLVSWLAVVLLAFLSTSTAVLLVLAGDAMYTAATQVGDTLASQGDIERVITEVMAVPALHDQQVIAMTLVAGLVGAGLASKYYAGILTTTTTAIGAALLAIVTPVWQDAINGELTVRDATLTGLSPRLFGAFLVIGLCVQAYRYRDELGLTDDSSSTSSDTPIWEDDD